MAIQNGKIGNKLTEFYKGKRIFITGHTGFKGTWLSKTLIHMGADVYGYSLSPNTDPSIYVLSKVDLKMKSFISDIRDKDTLTKIVKTINPDIVFHLAAQPLVRESYINPHETYETNVMGTVNILESIKICDSTKSFVNITTDKVYKNNEWVWAYRENDELNGYDPYSNSKSCSELVTETYKRSIYPESKLAISTMRAGNVIGGGDFSIDRIIPDCVRAVINKKAVEIRNPNSTRPYQHVLDPIFAYLLIGMLQFLDKNYSGAYNVGPSENGCVSTGQLVKMFCEEYGEGASWKTNKIKGPHEANFLTLDSSKIKFETGWKPVWDIKKSLKETVFWLKEFIQNPNEIDKFMISQISKFMEDIRW